MISERHYLAPLIGCALGLEPTDALALRLGLNFEFPRGYSRIFVKANAAPDWTIFRGSRHGINAYLNVMYQLSPHFELSGTLENRGWLVKGDALLFLSGSRTSATMGANWIF